MAAAALAAALAALPAAAASVCGLAGAAPGAQDQALANFAHDLGLREVAAFVAVANHLHETGRLPPCYLTKAEAEASGWLPGGDLWRVAPGDAIGGDSFSNSRHLLPARFEGHYREADLDYAGGHRGGTRLIYVDDEEGTWRQWVTLDHYRHFYKLPEGE